MRSSVLEALIEQGIVSADDVRSASALQMESGGQVLESLLRIGAVDEDDLLRAQSECWGVPIAEGAELPDTSEPVAAALRLLGLQRNWLARRQAAAWLTRSETTCGETIALTLAGRNPLDPLLREAVDDALSKRRRSEPDPAVELRLRLISRADLDVVSSLAPHEPKDAQADAGDDLSRLRELAEEAPTIDLVNQIFAAAIKQRASDIHFEPYARAFEVRYRIDGVISAAQRYPIAKFDAVSTRIKLISGMDIADRRLPQDGRQSIRIAGQEFDLRVSSLPGAWGESLVLRLLNKRHTLPSLEELGLEGRSLMRFRDTLHRPDGVVLVTGPTGSGKSTTLYKGLEEINDGKKKIITIEDPIEYEMERVTQTQVKTEIGYSFARGLRSILRQDPDVIMIGEIRDAETAGIAVQAALTGHTVLSTLHTNSSLLAVSRLRDLGVEPFLIASAVRGLAAQRLVRRVCESCATPVEAGADWRQMLRSIEHTPPELRVDLGDPQLRQGAGCEACANTGYRGRMALFEFVQIDESLRRVILSGGGNADLEAAARGQGFLRLIDDGLLKTARGMTTLSEVLRVVSDDANAWTQ